MLRFFILFAISLAILFPLSLYSPVDHTIIAAITSAITWSSATLIHLFDSDVISQGDIIRNSVTGFSIQVVRGCNAIDVVLILLSALLAFRATWKHKLVGFVAGFAAIQALNLVRIISLFYLGQWNKIWFEWFHLYLWQALIVLDAFVVWLLWLRYVARNQVNTAVIPQAIKEES